MGLGQLLLELEALLVDPKGNAERIYTRLADAEGLAEFEVARFYVASKMAGDLGSKLRSVDPRVRLEAVKTIPRACPRTVAAKLLRAVVKDPDPTTRKSARHAVRALKIHDVALRDPRFDPSARWSIGPYTPGAYNPSGWAFGVYGRRPRGAIDRMALRRHGLPPLETREDVAAFVGVEEEALPGLQRPGVGPGSAYVEFEVPKATGGVRRIAAPRKALREAQRKILRGILEQVPVHPSAHGFVAGRSTVTNARVHVGRALVLKLDLVDFFPSVHYRRVVGLFERLGYPTEAAQTLAGLCTYRPTLEDGTPAWPGLLPQGAPTSPAITNLICQRLDARLEALARKAGGRYSRYADDLTFSFDAEPAKLGHLLWFIDQICQQEGFLENTKKRRVFRRSAQQRVTGIVVNERLSIPRKERHRVRAILANVRKNGLEAEARGREGFEDHLEGWIAYATMVDPVLGARYAAELAAARARG